MILLDTDVLVDVAINRAPFSEPATELLGRIEQGIVPASVAWHSLSNLYYVVSPALGRVTILDFIAGLTQFVGVAATRTEDIQYAVVLPMTDFEDAMQVAAARACGAHYIVTRNTRDYTHSPIAAVNPIQAIQELV